MGVMFALLTLLIIATISSVFGGLDYSPLSLISGAGSFIVVCLLVNYIFGYIFNVKTQFQSSIITGLILSFIFTPPSEFNDYIVIALIGTIAMASKYLLAWRGRHVFNPAAVAAVIISLTGLSAASWWVATPVLLIPVVLFGTFTLYRTHRLVMGYLYVVIASIVSLLVTLLGGGLSMQGIWMIVASYPILFLAFFMLSEPLTQAPRNWQRNSIAAAIAVVGSLQLFVGNVLISPEMALIAGNLAAFLFSQRRALKLRYIGNIKYRNGQIAYDFQPLSPLHFRAGQYIELSLPHAHGDMRGMRRMFSIASGESDEFVRIITRHSDPSSSFKQALAKLKRSNIVTATGIYGDFVLPKEVDKKIVFLAGGIGITPFLSHLQSLTTKRDITLLYFLRDKNDVASAATLEDARKKGVRVILIENESVGKAVAKYVTDCAERIAYISGSPGFVDSAKKSLRSRSKQVITDYFTGY